MLILKNLMIKINKKQNSVAHVSAMHLVLVIPKNIHRITIMLSCHASDG